MGGLADFMQGPGAAIAPAIMGGLGAASGSPGIAMAGGNNMLGGMQAMFAQQQQQKLGAELAKQFQPPPTAVDAEGANRGSVSHDNQMHQYRVISSLLKYGKIDEAMDRYTKLNDMMQPKYGTISANQSVLNESTGEIGEQAPGTYSVQGNTGVHSTKGIGGTTDYGEDILAGKAAEVARKVSLDASNLATDNAGLAIDQQRADSYGAAQASQVGRNEAQAGLATAKAEKTAAEVNEGRALPASVIVQMLKELQGPAGDLLRLRNPKKWNAMMSQLAHAGVSLGEATAQNKVGNEDPDSTKEGVGDPQYEVKPLVQAKDQGLPSPGGGDYSFNPSTNSINPR